MPRAAHSRPLGSSPLCGLPPTPQFGVRHRFFISLRARQAKLVPDTFLFFLLILWETGVIITLWQFVLIWPDILTALWTAHHDAS
jgi:hypothetical protein